MSDKLWKATERAISTRIGGQRVPITGRARGDVPDIAHSWLSIEVKCRRALPKFLHLAMEQAVTSAKPNQLPVAILHETHKRHDNDLVVLRLSDFEEWFGWDGETEP